MVSFHFGYFSCLTVIVLFLNRDSPVDIDNCDEDYVLSKARQAVMKSVKSLKERYQPDKQDDHIIGDGHQDS